MNIKPIGIIRSPFKKPKGTPIQPAAAKGKRGRVEVYKKYAPGLKDLEGFSHIILIYHFHLIKKSKLRVVPYMDTKERGVFATRAPSRPNSIGLSVVHLIKIKQNVLFIKDVDILDKTPLLDIKPYLPRFDSRKVTKTGWLRKKIKKLHNTRDDARFID